MTTPFQVSLDAESAALLRDTVGEDANPVTLSILTSPDGHGLHVWLTEYPDEGCILLKKLEETQA